MKFHITAGLICVLVGCAPRITGPPEDLHAQHICHGLVIEDTLFIVTDEPFIEDPEMDEIPGEFVFVIDTIPIQVFVQVCDRHTCGHNSCIDTETEL